MMSMLWVVLGLLVMLLFLVVADVMLVVGVFVVGQDVEVIISFSFVWYCVDYEVCVDVGSIQIEVYEILFKIKVVVEQFSQVCLSYSEKMEMLDVLEVYMFIVDGQCCDVFVDCIYIQESYFSVVVVMYVDCKVWVVVFFNLVFGMCVVYCIWCVQNMLYFLGYFGLWEMFSVFVQYDDVWVMFMVLAVLLMQVCQWGVQGSQVLVVCDGVVCWEWCYQCVEVLQVQNWLVVVWEFSFIIMVSIYQEWVQVGWVYQMKSGEVVVVILGI